ncbi:hypothetical protein ACERK3_08515 [Phycisphaerales bacterium AB-hyl4]|uniref:HEAT repeat protein n=1 Tax=Natronomicrosphaera hydrolytica TaxID=3242702 RepID=A0ABV4U403_9BACT
MARPQTRKPGWRRSHLIALVISVMLSLTLVLPGVYWFGPDVHRWMMLRDLSADDLERRERALNFVFRRAADDERVRHGAVRELEQMTDEDHFQALVRALDLAGVWRRPTVTDEPWLRWLKSIAELPEPTSRLRAAQRLTALADMADDERLAELLETLVNDDDANVRYNALAATAELAGATSSAEARLPYESLIVGRTHDGEPAIAREAWLLVGLLDPVFGRSANWRDAQPSVAEAMVWASVQTNPDRPLVAAEAMNDVDVPARVRRAAAYALAFAEADAAAEALLPMIETAVAGEQVDGVVLWRAVRGVPTTEQAMALLAELATQRRESGKADRIELAALHRGATKSLHTSDGDDQANALRELAVLEHHWLTGTSPDAMPDAPPAGDMVRLLRVATAAEPNMSDLRPLLRHGEARLRDLACVVAVERFDNDVLDATIAELLVDYHDGAKISGAMLAGMTGLQLELLRERASRQSNWAVGQMMRLGLWMQGAEPTLDGRASRLLARRELPKSSMLLALLHRDPAAAWDELLAPQGEPTIDLVQLFDHYRWWYIARRSLPDDAPPLWWWADRPLQQMQVDVLRSWYLLHRHTLRSPAHEAARFTP